MSEQKNSRPSFSRSKIGAYLKGPTGITGTSQSASTPSGDVNFSPDDGYNASNMLFDNIDKLGLQLGVSKKNNEEVHNQVANDEYEIDDTHESSDEYDDYDNLTEEEAAELFLKPQKQFLKKYPLKQENIEIVFNDFFCRNCGNKFFEEDRFCGNCGNGRK
jgi:hypothetical protein